MVADVLCLITRCYQSDYKYVVSGHIQKLPITNLQSELLTALYASSAFSSSWCFLFTPRDSPSEDTITNTQLQLSPYRYLYILYIHSGPEKLHKV